MKNNLLLCLCLCLVTICKAQREENDNRFGLNLNKPERQEWLRDLGFGMFIHFSVDSQLGMVISHSMVGASEDYTTRFLNDLPKSFDPSKFDAYQIAKLAKLAGMKYIVFTAKHHSGFCMWNTKTTNFNIMNTPYGRDLLKEYVEGVRKAGLAVGLYYSPEDFKFLYDNNILVKRRDMVFDQKTTDAYADLIRRQTRELFSGYGKIDVLFIDGEPKEPCKEEAWKLQPDLVITRGAVNTPEQTLPGVALNTLWESCITMGTQWHYKPTNDDLKSGGRLIEILIETRAKGGNLLLNIGPHPDGYVPYEQETRLREVALWHFINHEAIENVRPWIIPNEENIWFTASKDQRTVYAVITGFPEWAHGERKQFVIRSVKSTSQTRISVLGQNDKVIEYQNDKDAKSYAEQKPDGLHISVVKAQRIYNNYKWPNPITVKLENILPSLDPPVVQTVNAQPKETSADLQGTVIKKGDAGTISVGFEYRPYAGFVENLYSKEWKKSQFKQVSAEGRFTVGLDGLEKTKEYEYRAVIIHPKLTVSGEIKRFKTN